MMTPAHVERLLKEIARLRGAIEAGEELMRESPPLAPKLSAAVEELREKRKKKMRALLDEKEGG